MCTSSCFIFVSTFEDIFCVAVVGTSSFVMVQKIYSCYRYIYIYIYIYIYMYMYIVDLHYTTHAAAAAAIQTSPPFIANCKFYSLRFRGWVLNHEMDLRLDLERSRTQTSQFGEEVKKIEERIVKC